MKNETAIIEQRETLKRNIDTMKLVLNECPWRSLKEYIKLNETLHDFIMLSFRVPMVPHEDLD